MTAAWPARGDLERAVAAVDAWRDARGPGPARRAARRPHHLPGGRARPPCSSRSTTRRTSSRSPRARGGLRPVPVLVVGQGLEPARGRRRLRRAWSCVCGDRASTALEIARRPHGARRCGAVALPVAGPAHGRGRAARSRVGRRACPGRSAARCAMNAGGHGSDTAAALVGYRVVRPGTGAAPTRAPSDLALRLPALRRSGRPTSWSGPSSRCAGATGRGRAAVAEIVALAPGAPARRVATPGRCSPTRRATPPAGSSRRRAARACGSGRREVSDEARQLHPGRRAAARPTTSAG